MSATSEDCYLTPMPDSTKIVARDKHEQRAYALQRLAEIERQLEIEMGVVLTLGPKEDKTPEEYRTYTIARKKADALMTSEAIWYHAANAEENPQ